MIESRDLLLTTETGSPQSVPIRFADARSRIVIGGSEMADFCFQGEEGRAQTRADQCKRLGRAGDNVSQQ